MPATSINGWASIPFFFWVTALAIPRDCPKKLVEVGTWQAYGAESSGSSYKSPHLEWKKGPKLYLNFFFLLLGLHINIHYCLYHINRLHFGVYPVPCHISNITLTRVLGLGTVKSSPTTKRYVWGIVLSVRGKVSID